MQMKTPLLFYCGSGGASKFDQIALDAGWQIGIRSCGRYKPASGQKIDFVDLDWKNYDHLRHLACCKTVRPHLASARDIERLEDLPEILREAEEISRYAEKVILIPKISVKLPNLNFDYILGYSVPTSYGGSPLPLSFFNFAPIHLLGGSIHRQHEIFKSGAVKVYSLDTKLDLYARYGKSSWPTANPRYQKLGNTCYEAFKISCEKSKEFFQ